MKPETDTELFSPDPPAVEPAPEQPSNGQSEPEPAASSRRAGRQELLVTLERLERTLDEMRGGLDATVREERHREFSAARLIGSIVQALAVGLVLWALSDWVFGELSQVTIKLGFAGVFQMGALTALLLGRESDRD
jgi:hypothetical protein